MPVLTPRPPVDRRTPPPELGQKDFLQLLAKVQAGLMTPEEALEVLQAQTKSTSVFWSHLRSLIDPQE